MSKLTAIEQLANEYHGLPRDTEISDHVQVLVDALNSVCTNEDAEATMLCDPQTGDARRSTATPRSAEELAEKAGVDSKKLDDMLMECGRIGLVETSYGDHGEIKYCQSTIFPGLAEALMTGRHLTKEGAHWYEYFAADMAQSGIPNLPDGYMNLHALPVRAAIKDTNKIMSCEELEPYLAKSKFISVSNCPCRQAEHALGNGCEHTYVDTCIQLGKYAESYLITGRSRQISKEEAYDILRRCEREGLVHQVSAYDPDHAGFICNCCGCSCVLLRNANIINDTRASRSNFVAEINSDNCVGCGACVESCNTNALSLGSCHAKTEPAVPNHPNPIDTEWTKDLWDQNWNKRIMVNEQGTAPCKTFCPAHISVQGYIKKAREGKYGEALKVIKRDNPFPAVCGRVCPHNCEQECTRSELDEPLAIDDIKKFIADKELESEFRYIPKIGDRHNQRAAVIGAGPAGLSCAYYLAAEGFYVTVFEKEDRLGGMMTLGIPSFRLENNIIDAEIDVLRELGVNFVTGVEVGEDITIQELRDRGFEAFYIAVGLQNGGRLGVPGEDADGVISGIEFSKNVNRLGSYSLDGKCVVIGGGNIGADIARTAVRCGADSVDLYCLESYDEMPMGAEDRTACEEEGINIHAGWGQTEILKKDGKCTGVKFRKCESVKNEEGRFDPKFDDSVMETADCSTLLYCIGQRADWKKLLDGTAVKLNPNGTAAADEVTYQTDDPDIFVGGDAYTGQEFVIDAIAEGKSGAVSLKRYLMGNNLKLKREREYRPLDKKDLELGGYDKAPRERISKADTEEAKKTFRDIRAGLTEEQVQKEATRCVGCGITVIDQEKCIGCGVCSTRCEFDAIKLTRRSMFVPPETMQEFGKNVMEYVMTRNKNIAEKKQNQAAE